MPRKGECRDFKERFEEKVDRNSPNGCWHWISAFTLNGYGIIWRNGKNAFAHRVAYELHRGPILKDMYVCHSCDNKKCVNPDHLFLGTAQDNAIDREQKGRGALQFGENNPRSKLSFQDVSEIRALAGNLLQKDIAIIYGVSREAIGKVLRGERWV